MSDAADMQWPDVTNVTAQAIWVEGEGWLPLNQVEGEGGFVITWTPSGIMTVDREQP